MKNDDLCFQMQMIVKKRDANVKHAQELEATGKLTPEFNAQFQIKDKIIEAEMKTLESQQKDLCIKYDTLKRDYGNKYKPVANSVDQPVIQKPSDSTGSQSNNLLNLLLPLLVKLLTGKA